MERCVRGNQVSIQGYFSQWMTFRVLYEQGLPPPCLYTRIVWICINNLCISVPKRFESELAGYTTNAEARTCGACCAVRPVDFYDLPRVLES